MIKIFGFLKIKTKLAEERREPPKPVHRCESCRWGEHDCDGFDADGFDCGCKECN